MRYFPNADMAAIQCGRSAKLALLQWPRSEDESSSLYLEYSFLLILLSHCLRYIKAYSFQSWDKGSSSFYTFLSFVSWDFFVTFCRFKQAFSLAFSSYRFDLPWRQLQKDIFDSDSPAPEQFSSGEFCYQYPWCFILDCCILCWSSCRRMQIASICSRYPRRLALGVFSRRALEHIQKLATSSWAVGFCISVSQREPHKFWS